jgi:hypothetical protein
MCINNDDDFHAGNPNNYIFKNFIIEFLKNSLRDPRPNFSCNQQFGNPSNHATFFTSLITWMIMEYILLDAKFRYSHTLSKLALLVFYPFIIYSRIYLKYHSVDQISNGILLGIFIGVFWFIIVDNFILKVDNPIRKIFIKMGLNNNLSSFNLLESYSDDSANGNVYKKYLELSKKQNEISKIKSDLKNFRSNLEQMEFAKNAKENKEKLDRDLKKMD